jgi:cellulose synthase/poly-beta-1,6-N-acetylglucosamine synthase-like glycosyltransferase
MNREKDLQRTLEIIPGAISWGIILTLAGLAILRPTVCAIAIIVFDFYWIIRTTYLTTLLIMAYRRLAKEQKHDWLRECYGLSPAQDWQRIHHLIIFPVYNESLEVLRPSLEALRQCRYPKEKMIVVVAFEERHPPCREYAKLLEQEFGRSFLGYLSTFHPDGLPGETRTKGANATWAAKQAKDFLSSHNIPVKDTVISCFDADTCVNEQYFSCLSYHFLTNPKPHQASYQPIPVYNNNIWYAPSFSRLVEISASFCEMIDSMRLEKFVTFSSHSMSFKTLIDIGYWPVDMISDDSVVYWKAFLFYNGAYRVIPLYTTVSMDVAYSTNFIKTIVMQYKQKRRWAWGVENFPLVVREFMKNRHISLFTKIRKAYNLLEAHVTWALWAILITLIAPLPILLGGAFFNQKPIGYNLPLMTGMLFNFTLFTSIVWILLSITILPPRPKDVSWTKYLTLVAEWILVPIIIVILGSPPALDAQTRLMLAKYMEFNTTKKERRKKT